MTLAEQKFYEMLEETCVSIPNIVCDFAQACYRYTYHVRLPIADIYLESFLVSLRWQWQHLIFWHHVATIYDCALYLTIGIQRVLRLKEARSMGIIPALSNRLIIHLPARLLLHTLVTRVYRVTNVVLLLFLSFSQSLDKGISSADKRVRRAVNTADEFASSDGKGNARHAPSLQVRSWELMWWRKRSLRAANWVFLLNVFVLSSTRNRILSPPGATFCHLPSTHKDEKAYQVNIVINLVSFGLFGSVLYLCSILALSFSMLL